MDRRGLLTAAGVAVSTLVFSSFITAAQPSKARPNNLIAVADDLGYGDLACYGHSHVQTPNIDRLARQRLKLTAYYAPGPLCSPARAGMLTGRSPNRTGIYSLDTSILRCVSAQGGTKITHYFSDGWNRQMLAHDEFTHVSSSLIKHILPLSRAQCPPGATRSVVEHECSAQDRLEGIRHSHESQVRGMRAVHHRFAVVAQLTFAFEVQRVLHAGLS